MKNLGLKYYLNTITVTKLRKSDLDNLMKLLIVAEKYQHCTLIKEMIEIKHYDNSNKLIDTTSKLLDSNNKLMDYLNELKETLEHSSDEELDNIEKSLDEIDFQIKDWKSNAKDPMKILTPDNLSEKSLSLFLELYDNYVVQYRENISKNELNN